MSGLKSLLNYRFQPREGEKLEVLGKTSPTSLELSPVKSGGSPIGKKFLFLYRFFCELTKISPDHVSFLCGVFHSKCK